jgi:antirestriction protein ArdC
MNSKQVYELVTNAIIEGLQKGVIPWRRPWSVMQAHNPASHTVYKGINSILLSMAPYSDPRWLTFKQATERNGSVRKGEKGTPVVFWKRFQITDKETGDEKTVPLLKHFYVFNVEQIDGLGLPPLTKREVEPIEVCESLVEGMPNKPHISHGGNRACYSPSLDSVAMPNPYAFESMAEYYGTLFHELGHSTGHATRLNRPDVTNSDGFGNEGYSREELVAELCSAFLCQVVGLDNDTEQTQAYINGWLTKLKYDPKMVVWAAGKASAAADYIQGKRYDSETSESTGAETRELVEA